MEIRTFDGGDGVSISYRRWLPAGRPRSSVVIAHGIADHSGRYGGLACALEAARHAVYAVDLRGHGLSAESTGTGETGPRGMDGVLDDIGRIVELARSENTGAPVFLFGHSIGAVIVQALVQRHRPELAGLVLCGSPGMSDNVRELFEGFRGPMAKQFRARSDGRYEWLTRDVDEVRAYETDPLCGDGIPLSYRYVAGLIAVTMRAMREEAVAAMPAEVPVLLMTGEADLVSNNGLNVRRLEVCLAGTGHEVTARYYAGARHDLLHELDAEQVQTDVVAWIEERVGGVLR